ncbi:MAG: outer membrane protein assembly factor BamB family protein, partial [Candidatus Methanospirareceae archaeon]
MRRRSGNILGKGFALVFIVSAIVVISVMPMLAMATSSWEQFQKDEVNSGKTTDLAPLNATKAWKVFTHTDDWGMSGVDVAPIVADGKVFVIDARGYALAFDAKSGEEIWNRSLSCEGWQFQLATPAYGGGKVFFATNDGHVYALDPETGDEIWSNRIAATYDQLNTPVTYADGRVYVGSYKSDNGENETGKYYCLDASTGNVLWSRPSGTEKGYYWAGAAVIGDYLVYGDRASVLTCVYRDNGTLADGIKITTDIPFNKSDAGGIRSSVAYSEGFVYFTSEGGYVWKIGFNESTGRFTEEGWAFEVEAGYSASTPVVYNGNVYAGAGSFSTDGILYCLNASDGEEEWNIELNGGVKASPAISIQGDDSYIYFTTNCANSRVYCVDEEGNEMWNFTTEEAGTSGGYILQGVAISDGYVYFGNDG